MGCLEDTDRAKLLMDHYKDTCATVQAHWKARDRLFLGVLLVSALVLLESVDPTPLYDGINRYLRAEYAAKSGQGDWEGLDFSVVSLMLRVGLFFLALKYFQRATLLARQFRYTHELEARLCHLLGREAVAREGTAHFSRIGKSPSKDEEGADNRPPLMKVADVFYAILYPTLIAFLAIHKLIEGDAPSKWAAIDFASALFSAGIVACCFLHMRWYLHVGREDRVPKPIAGNAAPGGSAPQGDGESKA